MKPKFLNSILTLLFHREAVANSDGHRPPLQREGDVPEGGFPEEQGHPGEQGQDVPATVPPALAGT